MVLRMAEFPVADSRRALSAPPLPDRNRRRENPLVDFPNLCRFQTPQDNVRESSSPDKCMLGSRLFLSIPFRDACGTMPFAVQLQPSLDLLSSTLSSPDANRRPSTSSRSHPSRSQAHGPREASLLLGPSASFARRADLEMECTGVLVMPAIAQLDSYLGPSSPISPYVPQEHHLPYELVLRTCCGVVLVAWHGMACCGVIRAALCSVHRGRANRDHHLAHTRMDRWLASHPPSLRRIVSQDASWRLDVACRVCTLVTGH